MVVAPPIQVQLVPSNFHRSLRPPKLPEESYPRAAPNSHRLPLLSIQEIASTRAPGTLDGAAVPCLPYAPAGLTRFAPLTQVQSLPSNFHRSLSTPDVPTESRPPPPKSHKFPLWSVQLVERSRAPGVLDEDAVPRVPYTPA